jgi:hypothetical protein
MKVSIFFASLATDQVFAVEVAHFAGDRAV